MTQPQSRKWQLTINNPAEKGIQHEHIRAILDEMKSVTYYCMADEIGVENQTPHIHLFLAAKSPIRFSTLKNRFPEAHMEKAMGTVQENRDYVAKTGKWEQDEKADTRIPGTFEEHGEISEEPGQGRRSDMVQLYELVYEGLSNAEIMKVNPKLCIHINRMDKIRQDILKDQSRDEWREVRVTYIFGETGAGKTRYVMEKHGYVSVYRVTDYRHPFDQYDTQPVLCFEEFRSSLVIASMLNYLDGYPLSLPARYSNRIACYDTVYILSNIDLKQQYTSVQMQEQETWKAFLRRIHEVWEYRPDGKRICHGSGWEYIFPMHDDWKDIGKEVSQPPKRRKKS